MEAGRIQLKQVSWNLYMEQIMCNNKDKHMHHVTLVFAALQSLMAMSVRQVWRHESGKVSWPQYVNVNFTWSKLEILYYMSVLSSSGQRPV